MALRVGVLGGSGLYEMEGLTDVRRVKVSTPFGEPSDRYIIGSLGGVEPVFLPRHGVGADMVTAQVKAELRREQQLACLVASVRTRRASSE